jgi:hypothetical protein
MPADEDMSASSAEVLLHLQVGVAFWLRYLWLGISIGSCLLQAVVSGQEAS